MWWCTVSGIVVVHIPFVHAFRVSIATPLECVLTVCHVVCIVVQGEYRRRGYQEVVSPNIYNSKLWVTSGHWQHYAENMFSFEVEKETFALKPMNCPGHWCVCVCVRVCACVHVCLPVNLPYAL